jgi:ribosomal protein S27AE
MHNNMHLYKKKNDHIVHKKKTCPSDVNVCKKI